MCDTQKRSLRYFCSCNREISIGNVLCRMLYRQKDVCVFLFYSFVLVFTDPELFQSQIIPQNVTPQAELYPTKLAVTGWHTQVCTEELLCTDSSPSQVPTVHALQHHASSRSPQSSVPGTMESQEAWNAA